MATAVRNYDKEARDMVIGLGRDQKYELYGIVLDQLQRRCSDDRNRELLAVKYAIERDRSLDQTRLKKMTTGDTGMASDINNSSLVGNQKKNKRKA